MAKVPKALLEDAVPSNAEVTWDVIEIAAERIGLALVMGMVVAVVYYFTVGRRKRDGSVMPLTLVLMSILVCMVMLVVGGSVARAFTLGGTLAIIRFRAVVDDTRDTAFVIAAVVVGMGMGTGAGYVIYIGLPIFAAVLIVAFLTISNISTPTHKIIVRIPCDRNPDELTREAFALCPVKPTLLGLETAKSGATIECTYAAKKLDSATILKILAAFRNVEGVQGVEVKPQ